MKVAALVLVPLVSILLTGCLVSYPAALAVAAVLVAGAASVRAIQLAERERRKTILLALAAGPKTVPEIAANARPALNPGPLYGTIRAMEREGLVLHREIADTTGVRGGNPRFEYSLPQRAVRQSVAGCTLGARDNGEPERRSPGRA